LRLLRTDDLRVRLTGVAAAKAGCTGRFDGDGCWGWVSGVPLTAFLNSARAVPNDLPISGSLLPPKSTNATINKTMISPKRPPMSQLLKKIRHSIHEKAPSKAFIGTYLLRMLVSPVIFNSFSFRGKKPGHFDPRITGNSAG
jgi:hypothetical protein